MVFNYIIIIIKYYIKKKLGLNFTNDFNSDLWQIGFRLENTSRTFKKKIDAIPNEFELDLSAETVLWCISTFSGH